MHRSAWLSLCLLALCQPVRAGGEPKAQRPRSAAPHVEEGGLVRNRKKVREKQREEALDRLQPGVISEPVISRFGVHLIQLLERREAKLTQREQRDMVRDAGREKKLDEAFTTWIQEARARAYVEYREAPQ